MVGANESTELWRSPSFSQTDIPFCCSFQLGSFEKMKKSNNIFTPVITASFSGPNSFTNCLKNSERRKKIKVERK